MVKVIKYLFLVSFVFLFSCLDHKGANELNEKNLYGGGDDKVTIEPSKEKKQVKEEDDDEVQTSVHASRDKEIRRLVSLSTKVDSKYKTSGSRRDDFYGGRACGDSISCRKICNKIYKRSSKCYKIDEDIVEDMEDTILTLRNIDDIDDAGIDPYILEVILEIDNGALEDIVEEEMSEGDLRSFLAWVAVDESVAEIFKEERSDVVEKALEKLGDLQPSDSSKHKQIGLNVGLITSDDTFLSLAADENNEAAFALGYDALSSGCDTNCKKTVLCAREDRNRSRSRYLGRDRSSSLCHTSSASARRHSRRGKCYLQGSVVWSYITELVEDKEIKEGNNEIAGTDTEKYGLTIDRCNAHCTGSKCDINDKKYNP